VSFLGGGVQLLRSPIFAGNPHVAFQLVKIDARAGLGLRLA
jgi:hypothetical protein